MIRRPPFVDRRGPDIQCDPGLRYAVDLVRHLPDASGGKIRLRHKLQVRVAYAERLREAVENIDGMAVSGSPPNFTGNNRMSQKKCIAFPVSIQADSYRRAGKPGDDAA